MAKPDTKNVYTEALEQDDLEVENQALAESLVKSENEKKVLHKTLQRIEEESALLRELFNNANNELTNLKKPALLVADVVSMIDENKAIIKLPNGNRFYCYIAKNLENLRSGDCVLVDQKSLNVIEKVDVSSHVDVE